MAGNLNPNLNSSKSSLQHHLKSWISNQDDFTEEMVRYSRKLGFRILILAVRTYLDRVLNNSGPFSDADYVPGEVTISRLESSKIL